MLLLPRTPCRQMQLQTVDRYGDEWKEERVEVGPREEEKRKTHWQLVKPPPIAVGLKDSLCTCCLSSPNISHGICCITFQRREETQPSIGPPTSSHLSFIHPRLLQTKRTQGTERLGRFSISSPPPKRKGITANMEGSNKQLSTHTFPSNILLTYKHWSE